MHESLRERLTAIKVAILKRDHRYDYGLRSQVAAELIELGFNSKTGESNGLSPISHGNIEAVENILTRFGICEKGLASELLQLISG